MITALTNVELMAAVAAIDQCQRWRLRRAFGRIPRPDVHERVSGPAEVTVFVEAFDAERGLGRSAGEAREQARRGQEPDRPADGPGTRPTR
ncbi:hypothetical protein ACWEIJ_19935 [Lentzea sp. NPDC004789]